MRSIELRALGDAWTLRAEMMQTLTAPAAIAAARNECEHNVVARTNSCNLGTSLLNNAGRFVPKQTISGKWQKQFWSTNYDS